MFYCVHVFTDPSISMEAPAQVERRYAPAVNRCIESSGYGDAEITECYNLEFSVQDGRLNQIFKMVLRRLPAVRKPVIKNGERAWIKTRDVVCQRHAAPEFRLRTY